MTQRAAARLLATVGLSRRQATAVLAAGLAGSPQVTTSALLYDADEVVALVGRAPLGDQEVRELCPHGLFVARRPADRLADLADGWGIGVLTAAWIRIRIGRAGHVPLVATVGGFVTAGAEIIYVDTWVGDDPSRPASTLTLRTAGPWLTALLGRRLALGPGRPWSLVGFDLLPVSGAVPPWENHRP